MKETRIISLEEALATIEPAEPTYPYVRSNKRVGFVEVFFEDAEYYGMGIGGLHWKVDFLYKMNADRHVVGFTMAITKKDIELDRIHDILLSVINLNIKMNIDKDWLNELNLILEKLSLSDLRISNATELSD